MNEEMNIDELENFDVSFAGVERWSEGFGGWGRDICRAKRREAFENTLRESTSNDGWNVNCAVELPNDYLSFLSFETHFFCDHRILNRALETHCNMKKHPTLHINKLRHPSPKPSLNFSNKMSFDSSHPKFPSIFIEFSFLYD
jgi:hypothetical protein